MSSVLGWTLVIIGIAAIVFVAVAIFLSAGRALEQHLKRMERGIKNRPGPKPCCPAGLGCNDPDESSRACLRREARRLGTAQEIHAIDEAWVRFCRGRGKHKRVAHEAYHDQRDLIIKRAINEAAERMQEVSPALPQLPAHLNGPEVLTGTVENGGRQGQRLRRAE